VELENPISLHTCTPEEVRPKKFFDTKQPADTPFVEKEEAREVGLCRKVHLGLQMPQKPNTNINGENRSEAWRKKKQWNKLFMSIYCALSLSKKELTLKIDFLRKCRKTDKK
jgi:hypothetical protein